MICAIQCRVKFRGRNRHFLAAAFGTLGAATCTVFSRRLAQPCSPPSATANRTKTLGRKPPPNRRGKIGPHTKPQTTVKPIHKTKTRPHAP